MTYFNFQWEYNNLYRYSQVELGQVPFLSYLQES